MKKPILFVLFAVSLCLSAAAQVGSRDASLVTPEPLGLAVLALAGYIYSADMLYYLFQYSLWMIVGLVVLFALCFRYRLPWCAERSRCSRSPAAVW